MVNCGTWCNQCARCFSEDLTSISSRAQLPTPQHFQKKACCVPSCFWVLWPTLFFSFARPKGRMQRVESCHLFFLASQCKCQKRECAKRSAESTLSQSPVLKKMPRVTPTVTKFVIASDISSGSIYGIHFQTFSLGILSDILFWLSVLAYYLASILTSYLASILTPPLVFYLAFFLIPYLASILAFSLVPFLAFYLAFYLTFYFGILSGNLTFSSAVLSIWHSFRHLFWHSFWHSIWHSILKLPQRPRARGWGPAVPTEIWSSHLRKKEEEGGGRRRKEEEGGGRRRKEEEGGGRRRKEEEGGGRRRKEEGSNSDEI